MIDRRKRISDEEKNKWIEMYVVKRYPVSKIALKRKVSYKTIYDYLYKAGIVLNIRPCKKNEPPPDVVLIDGYELGYEEAKRLVEIQVSHNINGNSKKNRTKISEEESDYCFDYLKRKDSIMNHDSNTHENAQYVGCIILDGVAYPVYEGDEILNDPIMAALVEP